MPRSGKGVLLSQRHMLKQGLLLRLRQSVPTGTLLSPAPPSGCQRGRQAKKGRRTIFNLRRHTDKRFYRRAFFGWTRAGNSNGTTAV